MNWVIVTPIVLAVLGFVLTLIPAFRRVRCANCGWRMNGFGSARKRTLRRAIEGGHICPKCGCEMDMSGTKIAPAAPIRIPVWPCIAVAASLILAIAVHLFPLFR